MRGWRGGAAAASSFALMVTMLMLTAWQRDSHNHTKLLMNMAGSGRHHVNAELRQACAQCMGDILQTNKPWKDAEIDATGALECIRGACKSATERATLNSCFLSHPSWGDTNDASMSLLAQKNFGKKSSTSSSKSDAKSHIMVPRSLFSQQEALDRQQLLLNWKRAKVFASLVGSPWQGKGVKLFTEWVPPLDPQGRPVPSWLRFVPSSKLSQSKTSTMEMEHGNGTVARNCASLSECSACVNGGCLWCGSDAQICSTECPAIQGQLVHEAVETCPASLAGVKSDTSPWGIAVEKQEENLKRLHEMVELARKTSGYPLLDALKHLRAKKTKEEILLDSKLNANSLTRTLAKLNLEQEKINLKRQMLYFRTEVGISTGREGSVYDMTVGGGGTFDPFVKSTTTWSLLGRPTPGWLHWGGDDDGGYLNPVGGSGWDPSVVNPAENGQYGPATNAYRKKHPHPESEAPLASTMAGSPLFGA
ncbi:hypothetical protein GUITHDRAFT_137822 [Guillardia theta CCMP2712]|uniref:PSI domain-containing protein n=3 Tax=Guillardia theta TaxID=55529 RepID=L1JFF6_GUITC|nr:hypothetical protein GUITHDRAFT_137822 [Guillardia theta CCMP2712]EKX46815.1 hypothetical protein GUITHDRAFT_137822 [Guillardia theta CCMP2712]|eukprot:XP_005833795.1 hypothetical protein GUITHDRAFT_137822 [Guillardia theta CCMP2712]